MKTKIGVFDSGIGGVTVLRECLKLVPNFEYIYYSDSINNPYGDKDYDTVIGIANDIVNNLISRECYIIIIACNTASAICVKYLRDKYPNIYFIAIEPAIKLAYENDGATLIMATKGTLDSEKFNLLYDKYHRDNYYLISCVGLANMIESDNIMEVNNYLDKYIKPYKGRVSNVVLGCTHYPLIKDNVKEVLGNVNLFDGAVGVSNRLYDILNKYGFESDINETKIIFIDSSNSKEKEERFYNILNMNER